jgi:hypothetical protein
MTNPPRNKVESERRDRSSAGQGQAALINLKTGKVEVFRPDEDGVIHIPAGSYAPTLFLDSQTSVAVLRESTFVVDRKNGRVVHSPVP